MALSWLNLQFRRRSVNRMHHPREAATEFRAYLSFTAVCFVSVNTLSAERVLPHVSRHLKRERHKNLSAEIRRIFRIASGGNRSLRQISIQMEIRIPICAPNPRKKQRDTPNSLWETSHLFMRERAFFLSFLERIVLPASLFLFISVRAPRRCCFVFRCCDPCEIVRTYYRTSRSSFSYYQTGKSIYIDYYNWAWKRRYIMQLGVNFQW